MKLFTLATTLLVDDAGNTRPLTSGGMDPALVPSADGRRGKPPFQGMRRSLGG